MTDTHKGSCLCKAVQYEVTGDPLTFRICHCTNCRKATGSSFMTNVFFKKENVTVIQGQDKLKFYRDKDTSSGSPLDRFFCTECGSNLFLSPHQAGGSIFIVALGTLNDECNWMPKTELFPEEKRKWVTGIELIRKKTLGTKL